MSFVPTFLTCADFFSLEPSLSMRRQQNVASVSILSHFAKARPPKHLRAMALGARRMNRSPRTASRSQAG
jgi:hypothetical protein